MALGNTYLVFRELLLMIMLQNTMFYLQLKAKKILLKKIRFQNIKETTPSNKMTQL